MWYNENGQPINEDGRTKEYARKDETGSRPIDGNTMNGLWAPF